MRAFLVQKIKENWKSGLTVSLVSLPMAISLAVASGTTPMAGIVTGVWAGLIAAIFGGSNYNIIGPAGSLVGILTAYAIIYGPQVLPTLAVVSGLFIMLAYFFRIEKYLIFFPASSLNGLILGIAITMGFNQLNYAIGLSNLPKHEKFLVNVWESIKHIPQASLSSFIIFAIFLIALILLAKLIPKIPSSIIIFPIGIIFGYLTTKGIIPLTLQTLDTKFPDMKISLFIPHSFDFSPALLIPALTVAIIAILETMISARLADGITKTKHNKPKEMLGLGLSNIASGIAGGIPATAVFVRTAVNIKTGCTHKTAGVLNAVFTGAFATLLIGFFKFTPLPVIAAILVSVSMGMVEREKLERMFKVDKVGFFIALVVAFVTIYEDPVVGMLFGGTIAMLVFMENISKGYYELTPSEQHIKSKENIVSVLREVKEQGTEALIYSIKGTLAYINSQSHIARFENRPIKEKAVILDLKDLYVIDNDGIDALGEIIELVEKQNKIILICGMSEFVEKMLSKDVIYITLKNKGHIFDSVHHALRYLSTK
ncbi:TPA: hypothetical protein DEO28_01135 [Candidatus Dependentiae bacterium]|nr:MAG: hypothetical protein UR14_C0003G0077 [candidate division TM6 bacterium GW2011_GWE2_31_21]KKP53759.1 MAG: hypothetical protein UR43_C0003G0080 [candidate division TM6 bacterium GW2011_GWF2_33_332]HBS48487.1 hypothetical protein [Candidatus Dependentiae bacterium]HBZ73102.1 hypothetical protein [Candidatus Dependentiae bacterium]